MKAESLINEAAEAPRPVTPNDVAEFQAILSGYLEDIHREHRAKMSGIDFKLEMMVGIKYTRIVKSEYDKRDGKPITRSAYGFIDMTNGNLLKAASYAQPAKGARGNIFAKNPLEGCQPYGMAYLR